MLLAIDAGNTNIVFAVYDGDKMRAQWRAVTQVSRTADEYGVWLGQLLELEGLSFKDLDAAIIATVVPAVLFDLRDLCRKYLKTEPLLVGDPAPNLSIEALHQAAALLPRVAIHRAQKVIGRDTVSSMQSGVYWGYVGLITGLINGIKAEYGKPMTVVATGGLAHLFRPDIPAIEHIDPDLTMRGLMLIHARNASVQIPKFV
jgi:type III pantothenate kinase